MSTPIFTKNKIFLTEGFAPFFCCKSMKTSRPEACYAQQMEFIEIAVPVFTLARIDAV